MLNSRMNEKNENLFQNALRYVRRDNGHIKAVTTKNEADGPVIKESILPTTVFNRLITWSSYSHVGMNDAIPAVKNGSTELQVYFNGEYRPIYRQNIQEKQYIVDEDFCREIITSLAKAS